MVLVCWYAKCENYGTVEDCTENSKGGLGKQAVCCRVAEPASGRWQLGIRSENGNEDAVEAAARVKVEVLMTWSIPKGSLSSMQKLPEDSRNASGSRAHVQRMGNLVPSTQVRRLTVTLGLKNLMLFFSDLRKYHIHMCPSLSGHNAFNYK